jgi:hypothetical protein
MRPPWSSIRKVLRFIRIVGLIKTWSRSGSTIDLEGRSARAGLILAYLLHMPIHNDNNADDDIIRSEVTYWMLPTSDTEILNLTNYQTMISSWGYYGRLPLHIKSLIKYGRIFTHLRATFSEGEIKSESWTRVNWSAVQNGFTLARRDIRSIRYESETDKLQQCTAHYLYSFVAKNSKPPVWRRVRIPPPQSLRVVRGDVKGTQCPGV